jgi:DNA-binding transcriptional MerR regulator
MTQEKSDSAFRTISEVSQKLALQPHVLRFWESKFSQIQPVKRAAGRRFYRPDDVALIGGIRFALYEQGMTIKGVQKLLQDKGIAYIRGLAAGDEAPNTPNTHKAPEALGAGETHSTDPGTVPGTMSGANTGLNAQGRDHLQAAKQSLQSALASLRDG